MIYISIFIKKAESGRLANTGTYNLGH